MVNMLLPGCRFSPQFAAISIWKKNVQSSFLVPI